MYRTGPRYVGAVSIPPLPTLTELMAQTPMSGRAPALLLGVLLLVQGERLYRFFVLLPGILLGAWAAATVQPALGLDLRTTLVIGAALAVVGAALCHFMETWGVRLTGAMVGAGVSVWAWPLASASALPWWAPFVSGVVVALLFPKVYRWLLKPVTALVGAELVSWAVKRPTDALLVLGLAFAGTIAQSVLGGKGGGGKKA